jgi:hypothetical protein
VHQDGRNAQGVHHEVQLAEPARLCVIVDLPRLAIPYLKEVLDQIDLPAEGPSRLGQRQERTPMKYSLRHDPSLESRLDMPNLHATIIFRPRLTREQWSAIPAFLRDVDTIDGLRMSLALAAAEWGGSVNVRPISEYPPETSP